MTYCLNYHATFSAVSVCNMFYRFTFLKLEKRTPIPAVSLSVNSLTKICNLVPRSRSGHEPEY